MDFINTIQIIHNPSGLITVNETLIFQLFSFLIFLFIINRIMFRPLRETMDKRIHHIEDIKKDIDDADIEFKKVANLIKKGELAIKKEAQELKQNLEASGNQEAAEHLNACREEIKRLKVTAEQQIAEQIEEARKQITSEFETVSISIMEKILDRRLAS